jgi:hypothetical protein
VAAILTDREIGELVSERKPEIDPVGLLSGLKPDLGQRRAKVTIIGALGSRFDLHVRQSDRDPYDFSVILTYVTPTGRAVNLRRHNGPSHPHVNPIENTKVGLVCHIHEATERYQRRGFDIEGYAKATSSYTDLDGALRSMLRDANFEPPAQLTMLQSSNGG